MGNPEPDKKEVKQIVSLVKEKYEGMRRLDPQALIEQAIQKESGIEILERLFALAKDVRAEQAREKWNEAMAEFQTKCPKILKTKTGDIGGRFKYNYAPLEEILGVIQPIMAPLGLSVSWRNKFEPGKVVSNCRISHDLGHLEESGEVAMPVSEEKMGATSAQRVGIALTYSKRYSLLSIIGIAPEDDPDAAGDDKAPVKMPQRASEKPAETKGAPWTGKILKVKEVAGNTDGRAWTRYVLEASDNDTFFSFDGKIAEFARESIGSLVYLFWEPGKKGGRSVISIEPAINEDAE